MTNTYERRIEFTPAFDKRAPNPAENYGIHGVELRFVLIGPRGAVQFLVYTNWHLKHVQQELDRKTTLDFPHLCCHPLPADVGYHAHVPQYEGQDRMTDHCTYLDGPCYYDGSGCAAETLYWQFVERGTDAVWEELQRRHDGLTVA